ncbi:PaaI family thioesterase [Pseudogemmobacter sonorensis]|uniref:PaaI family thioesterase n=1 Tax=Pseudogemmobacter sonorensis TaxID=2989681 RepID=UPI0036A869FF
MASKAEPEIHPIAAEQPPFARHLGLRLLSATPERVEAEMVAAPDLINRNGHLHGGAIMALADNLGGTAAFLNLGPGEGTTTVESKTNFFRPVPAGEKVRAVAVPLHLGRSTQVWQTTLTLANGKIAAIVTQTQFTLKPKA